MSFPITDSPTIIDTVGRTIPLQAFNSGNTTQQYWGPFIVGSAQYIIGFTNDVSSPRYLAAFKRTTGEWAEVGQNRAVPPQSTAVPSTIADGQCYFDVANSKIWLAYRDSSAKVTLVDLDCATDTWGTPGATLTLGGSEFWTVARGQQLFRQADGTFYLFYCRGVTPFGLYQLTYAAGAWSGETAVDSGTSSVAMLYSGVMDADERKHLHYRKNDTLTQLHAFVDSSGSASSPATIETLASGVSNFAGSRSVIWNSSTVVFVFFYHEPSPFTRTFKAYRGTPLSAPSFTVDTVLTAASPEELLGSTVLIDKDGAMRALIQMQVSAGDQPLYLFTNSGAGWDAGTEIYNTEDTPPDWFSAPSAGGLCAFMGAHQFGSGAWLLFFNVNPVPGTTRAAGYYVSTGIVGCLYRAIQS